VLIGNYARQPIVMDHGEGPWVWDTDGRKYLDLFAGFGPSSSDVNCQINRPNC